mmetsp:Transcript_16069/g.51273  ORF Transcript_16069/g.51273 Transcript_16069/m.51273 type:complete len:326 (+) Transcript_16069:3-980(+)
MADEGPGYFAALDALFGVDRVNHGDPDEPYEWKWSADAAVAGNDVQLRLADGSNHLMAHHVWQSALTLAEEICCRRIEVQDKTVVELGAGAALPSIAARRLGAKAVVASDYPEDSIVANMARNLEENAMPELDRPAKAVGFGWGTSVDALAAAIPSEEAADDAPAAAFDLIIMADTLWLRDQHHNLLTSCRDLMLQNGTPDVRAILTFMNHDNGQGVAEGFFKLAENQYELEVVEKRVIAWRRTADGEIDENGYESDSSDPETYGPVYLRVLAPSASLLEKMKARNTPGQPAVVGTTPTEERTPEDAGSASVANGSSTAAGAGSS